MKRTSAKRLGIIGTVQGVGYRASFEAQARSLGLSGWVRNRADGSVEAAVAGEADAIERIISWARCGPRGARVDQVVVSDFDGTSIAEGRFDTLPTR
ncbi:MAG TPA: acylphosphatase [Burkholderiaceae bacterium]|jgi:acylphosphatase|nr:acylphosphatase [Burkholderiaceae bacterium]